MVALGFDSWRRGNFALDDYTTGEEEAAPLIQLQDGPLSKSFQSRLTTAEPTGQIEEYLRKQAIYCKRNNQAMAIRAINQQLPELAIRVLKGPVKSYLHEVTVMSAIEAAHKSGQPLADEWLQLFNVIAEAKPDRSDPTMRRPLHSISPFTDILRHFEAKNYEAALRLHVPELSFIWGFSRPLQEEKSAHAVYWLTVLSPDGSLSKAQLMRLFYDLPHTNIHTINESIRFIRARPELYSVLQEATKQLGMMMRMPSQLDLERRQGYSFASHSTKLFTQANQSEHYWHNLHHLYRILRLRVNKEHHVYY